jgi:hypothetical protein
MVMFGMARPVLRLAQGPVTVAQRSIPGKRRLRFGSMVGMLKDDNSRS